MLEATLKQRESKLGPDHPDTLTSRNNLAAAYLAAGRTAEAITLHEATLKLRESKLGPDHPDTLTSRNNLAAAYLAAGRTDEAIKMHEATLKLTGVEARPRPPRHAHQPQPTWRRPTSPPASLTGRSRSSSRPSKASGRSSARTIPRTLSAEQFLADAYAAAESTPRPRRLLRERSGAGSQAVRGGRPDTRPAMASLGSNLIQPRKWAEAEPILRECLAIREKAQPDDWTTFNTRSQLGGSLLGQKKYAEAEPLILARLRGHEGPRGQDPRAGQAPPDRGRRAGRPALRGLGQEGQGGRVAGQAGESLRRGREQTLRPTPLTVSTTRRRGTDPMACA